MAVERSKFEQGIPAEELVEMLPNLLDLEKQPNFLLYQELLKAGAIEARQVAFDSADSEIGYWRGFVAGMQHARGLVGALIKNGSEMVKKESPQKDSLGKSRGSMMDDSDTSF